MHGAFPLSLVGCGGDPLAGALECCPIGSLPGARHDAARLASSASMKRFAIGDQGLRVQTH